MMSTRAYGAACTACRRWKVKCVYTAPEARHQCDRCIKAGRTCHAWVPRRRLVGQKGVIVTESERVIEQSSQAQAQSTHQGNSPASSTETNLLGRADSIPNDTDFDSRDVGGGAKQAHEASVQNSPDSEQNIGTKESIPRVPQAREPSNLMPPSFVSSFEDARSLSLATVLNPDISLTEGVRSIGLGTDLGTDQTTFQDDPITRMLVNWPSARHLIEGYFNHFEYNVGFLDPQLYTFDYIRESSSFLFTTLLSISSRVFRPDIYCAMRDHAESLLGRVLLACDSKLENIWAIICMYYWKELSDQRGYTLIGFAMRLASSSEWNATRRNVQNGVQADSSLPMDERSIRKRRDQDRIWLYLGSLDRTLCLFTDRPLPGLHTAGHITSRTWMKIDSNFTYAFGDARAIAGQELSEISKLVDEFITSSRGHPWKENICVEFGVLIQEFNTNMIAWSKYWAPVFVSFQHSVPSLESQIHLYCNQIRTYFNLVHLNRILVSNNNNLLDPAVRGPIIICYTTSLNVLQEAVKLGRLDILYYLWDTAHLMVAFCAMVLLKMLKQGQNCAGVSVENAYIVLVDVVKVHAATVESLLSYDTNNFLEAGHNAAPRNSVEAQTQLLRHILLRVKTDLSIPQHENSLPFMETIDFSHTLQRLEDDQMLSYQPVAEVGSRQTLDTLTTGGREFPATLPPSDTTSLEYVLRNEVKDSIDRSLIDSMFLSAGLSPWDQPSIFMIPK